MSDTQKWTPGPHYVGSMNDALFIIAQPPSPAGSDVPIDTPHPRQKILAKVDSADIPPTENQANASLYAAAPELYAACELALNAFEKGWAIDWNELTLALAKARGENR